MTTSELVVLRLNRAEAEKIVKAFETDGGMEVSGSDIELLERYFADHPDDIALSDRYRAALNVYA